MLGVDVDPAAATPLPPERAGAYGCSASFRIGRRTVKASSSRSRWSATRRFSPWVRRSDAWALIPVGRWVKITAVSTLLRFWPPGPVAAWLGTRTGAASTAGSRAAGWSARGRRVLFLAGCVHENGSLGDEHRAWFCAGTAVSPARSLSKTGEAHRSMSRAGLLSCSYPGRPLLWVRLPVNRRKPGHAAAARSRPGPLGSVIDAPAQLAARSNRRCAAWLGRAGSG